MRRALIIIAALAEVGALAHAAPDAGKHKAAPDRFVKAAGEAFTAALAADQQGDLRAALGLYQKAYGISPHPSTIYNIADVQRRLNLLDAAIRSYETYLALAPAAADRKEVEALIDKLARTPATLLIVTPTASDPNAVDFKTAYVLVDGEIKLKPGAPPHVDAQDRPVIMIDVPPGDHTIDVVTPITYGSHACQAGPGERRRCELTAPPRTDGSVVISSSRRSVHVALDRKGKRTFNERLVLPPGAHKLMVRDRSYECPAVVIDVPAGGDVAYLWLATTEHEQLERCRTLDVKQRTLHFAP